MEQIAIISDIHGNLEALNTVLKDIRKRGIKRIFCLGDIIFKGIHSSECIRLIRDNCEVIIKGNCEDYFNKDILSSNPSDRTKWNNKFLSKEDKEFISKLSYSYEFYMSGSLIRLFHANPFLIAKATSTFDTLERKYEMFLHSENTISDKIADIVIFGHNHTPLLDKLYNRILINTGSVEDSTDIIRNDKKDGNVKLTTKATYLIIEGEYGSMEYKDALNFQFVNLVYDIDKEIASWNDDFEFLEYKNELYNGKYRDMEKIKEQLKGRGVDVDTI